MKLALPTRNNKLDDHFGHCEYFTIFELNDAKELIGEETLEAPSGCGCKSDIASELAKKGVLLLLAGNMGQGAVDVLSENNIRVIRGCSGDVKDVLNSYLKGDLVDSAIGCASEDCGNH